MNNLSVAGIIGFILAIVLVYDILQNYKGAVAIENSSASGSVSILKVLEGR